MNKYLRNNYIKRNFSMLVCAVIILFGLTFAGSVNAGATTDLLFSDNFDSRNTGALSGQNGWLTAVASWTVTATTSGKNIVGGNSNYNTAVISQITATSSDTRLKVDFLATSGNGIHTWLRRSSAQSTASGYDFYRISDGKFYLAHVSNTTVVALTNATVPLTTGAWYTIEFEVIDDELDNPVLNAWVYPQGTSRPASSTLVFTDTSKRSPNPGLAGIGGFSANVTADNFEVYTGDNGPATIPEPPTSLGAAASTTQITVSWTPGLNGGSAITNYSIEYRTGANPFVIFNDGISTSTSATVTGLASSTGYDFKVSAINAIGTSTAATLTATTTSGLIVPTPTLISSTSTGGTGTVTTEAIDTTGASLLVLTLGVYNTSAAGVTVTDSQGNTWRALSNRAGTSNIHTTIWYAYDKSGAPLVTSPNHTVTVARVGVFYPAVIFSAWSGTLDTANPFDVQANNGGTGSSLSVSLTPSQNNSLIISTFGSDTFGTYSSNNLTLLKSKPYVLALNQGNAQAYTFQRNAATISTTWSNTTSGSVATVIASFKPNSTVVSTTSPSAPTNPTSVAETSRVTLNWEPPASNGGSAVTDYAIEYRKDGGSFSLLPGPVSTATSTVLTGLDAGSLYNFRIYAINAIGTSSPVTHNVNTVEKGVRITTPARNIAASSSVATLAIDRVECSTTFYIPYIQTSPNLTVSADVEDLSMPIGGGVKFVLTGANTSTYTLYDMSAPYSVIFTDLEKDEYSLAASIVDSNQIVPTGTQYTDTATRIGVGDIIVAIGDSITEGYDGTAWDVPPYTSWINVPARSNDHRNYPQCGISSGYYQDHWQELSHHIALNNTLSAYHGYPIFILNEGSAGITSGGYVTRTGVTSWQNRMNNLAPNRWIVHLGVNDLGGSPTFQTNMQTLIDTFKNTYGAIGQNIVLAIPSIRTNWQPYLNNLVQGNSLTQGPNFNSFYANNTSPTLYVGVHPNTAGHVQMGRLWGISMIAPKNVAAVQNSNTVQVNWDDLSSIEPTISGYNVYYGLSTTTMSTVINVGSATSTTISSGLVSGQTYYVGVRGYDNDAFLLNYTATSTPVSFTYLEDSIAPSVEVTSPAESATVSGDSVSLTASSTDNTAVAGVSFYINNTRIGTEDTTAPYAVTWDSTATTSGSRNVVAAARDTAGNWATSSAVSFTVSNLGYVPSSIQASSTSDGAVITWSTSALSSSKVNFGLNSNNLASTTGEFDTSPRVSVHSSRIRGLASCTRYSYSVTSRNSLGESATSSTREFTTAGCTQDSSVSSTAQDTVDVLTGGTVNGDTLTLTVPSGITASSSEVYFRINTLSESEFFTSLSGPTGKRRATAGVFNLRALIDETITISTFYQPIVVRMSYDASDITGIDEESLRIYRYNGSTWNQLSNCVVNTTANTVTCETSNFSDFALFGDESTSQPVVTPTPAPVSASSIGGGSSRRFLSQILGISYSNIDGAAIPTDKKIQKFNFDIRKGETLNDVRELQKALNTLGYTVAVYGPGSAGKETRFFGRATEAAVRRYQRFHGLPVTGFFGPLTRQSMNLKLGSI